MEIENLEQIEAFSPNEFLDDTLESLQEYAPETEENLSETNEGLESMESRYEGPEIVTDLEMTEGIASALEKMDEIKYENWSKLTLAQKTEVLNKIEQTIAVIEHRPALKVEIELMKPKTLGYQCAAEHKIALNSLYVGKDSPEMHKEVIDTIIHEGRHAYQHYNTDVKVIHESMGEVMSWYENFYDAKYKYYQSGYQKVVIPYRDGTMHDVDFRLYYYQPVEIDARNFTTDVINKLQAKGIVN